MNPNLTRAQADALAHVERHALRTESETEASLVASREARSVSQTDYHNAITHLRQKATVALAFHPERASRSAPTVAQGLLSDGIYKNQYETGLSSGSPSARPGGKRDQWERHLFGGAYHRNSGVSRTV